jgi:hypothetical protein
MATAALTQTNYNAPYHVDFTSSRRRYHGTLAFAAGNYVTGGLLPNWNPTTGVYAGSIFPGGYTQANQASALITGVTVTGTTCVFSAKATPTVGQYVTFSGFTAAGLVAFNGITAQVTAVTANTSFTCVITTTAVTTAGNGFYVFVVGPDTQWIQSIAGSGYQYAYNKATGLIQIFTGGAAQSPLTELSAGALPAAVVNDIIEYEAEYVTA